MYWIHSSPTGQINKIDSAPVDGLEGVNNSLAYKVEEIERHFHSYESWFEAAGTPDGEVHVADRVGTVGGGGAFRLDAGNLTWGNWVQVLGSDDTPARTDQVKYDLHRIDVEATERSETYYFQFAFGDSGAAGLAAGDYTESVFHATSNQIDAGPVTVQSRRKNVGRIELIGAMVFLAYRYQKQLYLYWIKIIKIKNLVRSLYRLR